MNLTAEQLQRFTVLVNNTKRLGAAYEFIQGIGLSSNDANILMNAGTEHDYRKREKALTDWWQEKRIAAGKNPICYSFSELKDQIQTTPAHGDNWGNFTFRRDNLTLEHKSSYYIDLERCASAGQLLDWIFQISNKSWMTQQDKADLLDALEDVLHPQEAICPFGNGRPVKDIKAYILKRTTDRIEVFKEETVAAEAVAAEVEVMQ